MKIALTQSRESKAHTDAFLRNVVLVLRYGLVVLLLCGRTLRHGLEFAPLPWCTVRYRNLGVTMNERNRSRWLNMFIENGSHVDVFVYFYIYFKVMVVFVIAKALN